MMNIREFCVYFTPGCCSMLIFNSSSFRSLTASHGSLEQNKWAHHIHCRLSCKAVSAALTHRHLFPQLYRRTIAVAVSLGRLLLACAASVRERPCAAQCENKLWVLSPEKVQRIGCSEREPLAELGPYCSPPTKWTMFSRLGLTQILSWVHLS